MTTFNNCGWVNWKTIFWGFMDGVTISGPIHIQGCYDTPWKVAGSENAFWEGAHCFMDSAAAYPIVSGGKPFFISRLEKSHLGTMMSTARDAAYPLLIEAGGSLHVTGYAFDAQTSDPFYGSAVRITGGEGSNMQACSFKGGMTNPSLATGGSSDNAGWIHIDGSGVRGVVIGTNSWDHTGNNAPDYSVPLVYVSAATPANEVYVDAQAMNNWGGNNYVLQQGAANRIAYAPHPKAQLVTA